ncbi:TetR/AcrR family transcriptional regulator [Candidatus Neomarinimicrobiota bacterium]
MTIEERRSKEKESRRNAILAAAEKRFAKEGFHVTTLDEVAADVDISKATIYLYFKNKEELFFSILEEKFDQYIQSISKRLEGVETLKEAITELVTGGLDFLKSNHHFFRLILSEQSKSAQGPSREMHERFFSKQREYMALIEKTFAAHMQKESLTSFSSKSLALCVNGAINAHMMSWLITGGETDLDRAREDILTILLNGCYPTINNK